MRMIGAPDTSQSCASEPDPLRDTSSSFCGAEKSCFQSSPRIVHTVDSLSLEPKHEVGQQVEAPTEIC